MALRPAGVIHHLLVLACCSVTLGELLDLSYAFDNSTQYWQGQEIFNLTEVSVGLSENGYWYENYRFDSNEHGGTHLDAPSHFFNGGWSTDEIPVDRLIANAAVVDITERSSRNRDAELTLEDLTAWRSKYGQFKFPTIVLVRTGFSKFWPSRRDYFGERPSEPGVKHFPGIGEAAAFNLSRDPGVVGVGIDTPSIDPGTSQLFPAHVTLFSTNRFALENLADLSRVPPAGARIFALPMKIGGGSGGPCRVVVELPNSATGGPREGLGHNGPATMDRVRVVKEMDGSDPVPRARPLI